MNLHTLTPQLGPPRLTQEFYDMLQMRTPDEEIYGLLSNVYYDADADQVRGTWTSADNEEFLIFVEEYNNEDDVASIRRGDFPFTTVAMAWSLFAFHVLHDNE
jgi:hypothetical protein